MRHGTTHWHEMLISGLSQFKFVGTFLTNTSVASNTGILNQAMMFS